MELRDLKRELILEGKQQCSKCRIIKPVDFFYDNPTCDNAKAKKCKVCCIIEGKRRKIGIHSKISNFKREEKKIIIDLDHLIEVCVDLLGVSEDKIRYIAPKGNMETEAVWSRFLIFNHLKQNTVFSLTKIGKPFKKDHASVLHGLKKYKNLNEVDKPFQKLVKEFNELVISH